MKKFFFEEAVGQCEVTCLSTVDIFTQRCVTTNGRLRRVMAPETGTICQFHCIKDGDYHFINPKQYPVVKAFKSRAKDPLFDDYVEFYREHFRD